MRKSLISAMALLTALLTPSHVTAQVSDRDLFERVADAIDRYPQYGMFDAIEVGVDNRNVTLGGWVTTQLKQEEILKRVQKIDGIRSLTNSINVLPLSRRDDEMRVQVASAIYNNPMFWMQAQMPVPPIHIIVNSGKIILTGMADSDGQRTTAAMLAQRVGGNFGVTNLIKVPQSRPGR